MAASFGFLCVFLVFSLASIMGQRLKCHEVTNATEYEPSSCIYVGLLSELPLTVEEASKRCSDLDDDSHAWHLPKLNTPKKLDGVNQSIQRLSNSTKQAFFRLGLVRENATTKGEAENLTTWLDPTKWRWTLDNTTLDASDEALWKKLEPHKEREKQSSRGRDWCQEWCAVAEWNKTESIFSIVRTYWTCDLSRDRKLDNWIGHFSSGASLLVCESMPKIQQLPPTPAHPIDNETQTSHPDPALQGKKDEGENASGWQWTFLGASVGVCFVCLVAAVGAVLYIRRRRRRLKEAVATKRKSERTASVTIKRCDSLKTDECLSMKSTSLVETRDKFGYVKMTPTVRKANLGSSRKKSTRSIKMKVTYEKLGGPLARVKSTETVTTNGQKSSGESASTSCPDLKSSATKRVASPARVPKVLISSTAAMKDAPNVKKGRRPVIDRPKRHHR